LVENQQHQNHDPLYKKKYAKEAWPGRKSINTDLVPGLTGTKLDFKCILENFVACIESGV